MWDSECRLGPGCPSRAVGFGRSGGISLCFRSLRCEQPRRAVSSKRDAVGEVPGGAWRAGQAGGTGAGDHCFPSGLLLLSPLLRLPRAKAVCPRGQGQRTRQNDPITNCRSWAGGRVSRAPCPSPSPLLPPQNSSKIVNKPHRGTPVASFSKSKPRRLCLIS